MIVGPVGCGKSTFLKALLGETPLISGEIHLNHLDVAICEQTPWIVNASIRENIVASSLFDIVWYTSVIHACALDTDINRMTNGDHTIVGNQGIKLSGGQKQRIVSSPEWMLNIN